MAEQVLTLMIFIPLVGMAFILCLPSRAHGAIRAAGVAATVPPLFLGIWLLTHFDPQAPGFQFVRRVPWIAQFDVHYHVGIDGISLTMVLLTALLSFLCMIASFNIEKGVKGYFALFCLLDTGMMGVFCALDFFLFFVFWEMMLVPILYLYFASSPHSFDMTKLGALVHDRIPLNVQIVLWVALFVGFAIKIPAFPFHTWLPDAHVEAPTAISVILAGVLLKMGTYGILRINFGILPAATLAPFWQGQSVAFWLLAALGTFNIVYGAVCAMAQADLKKLVAYSSISHMGYVMLGLAAFTPQGINGAVLQMFNHGTITAMLFLLVGVIYDRAHHRQIEGFGGLASIVPVYTGVTGFAFFAAMGLPGLSAFISEVLVLLGAWKTYPEFTVVAASAVVFTAGYLLWTLQRMYLGPPNPKYATLAEINGRELFTLLPLAAIVVFLGVYPMPILNLQDRALVDLNKQVVNAAASPPRAERTSLVVSTR